jgi:hypothetical protein
VQVFLGFCAIVADTVGGYLLDIMSGKGKESQMGGEEHKK